MGLMKIGINRYTIKFIVLNNGYVYTWIFDNNVRNKKRNRKGLKCK